MIKVHQHALINQMLYQQKKKICDQMMCSSDQLRKLVAQVRPVGRMSLEPCHPHLRWPEGEYICVNYFFNNIPFIINLVLGCAMTCKRERNRIHKIGSEK